MLRKLFVLATTVALASAATAVKTYNLQGNMTVAGASEYGKILAISKTGNYLAVADTSADNFQGKGM